MANYKCCNVTLSMNIGNAMFDMPWFTHVNLSNSWLIYIFYVWLSANCWMNSGFDFGNNSVYHYIFIRLCLSGSVLSFDFFYLQIFIHLYIDIVYTDHAFMIAEIIILWFCPDEIDEKIAIRTSQFFLNRLWTYVYSQNEIFLFERFAYVVSHNLVIWFLEFFFCPPKTRN